MVRTVVFLRDLSNSAQVCHCLLHIISTLTVLGQYSEDDFYDFYFKWFVTAERKLTSGRALWDLKERLTSAPGGSVPRSLHVVVGISGQKLAAKLGRAA